MPFPEPEYAVECRDQFQLREDFFCRALVMPVWINVLEFYDFGVRVIENCLDKETLIVFSTSALLCLAFWILVPL